VTVHHLPELATFLILKTSLDHLLQERLIMQKNVTLQSKISLNHGPDIPVLGYGTACTGPRTQIGPVLPIALDAGYRLIDTAMIYMTERIVGDVLAKASIPRTDIFIATKVWKDAMRFRAVRESVEESLGNLHLEYVDLLLIHRPLRAFNVDTWHVLEDLLAEGKTKAIGVSNFTQAHIEAIREQSNRVPAVNQIENHPFFYRKELIQYCNQHHILIESYAPLMVGKKLQDPRLVAISQIHRKTPAQIVLRWNIQHGFVPIPCSVNAQHIKENAQIFDFALSRQEMTAMDGWHEEFEIYPDREE
jgi:diketogulonate reductase-like aldo/keto reductase